MQLSGAREQQFHVVGNFSHGSDGRTRRFDRVYLIDSDCRRDADYLINFRFVHPLQELANVRRERLDISALTFGIERIECEARFAGTAHTCNNGKLVYRDTQINRLEIVLRCSLD
jgi:hypothetical protein